MVKVKIEGLREALKALENVPKEALGKSKRVQPIKSALRDGAKLIRDRAKALAPKDTGRLTKAIKVRSKGRRYLRRTQEGVQVWIDPGKSREDPKGAFYAKWVEYGTSKMPAQPFMRPAMESEATAAIKAAADSFKGRVAEIVRRSRGR